MDLFNLDDESIHKQPIHPKLKDYKKNMAALVNTWVLYIEADREKRSLIKITNVDDTEKVFWNFKHPELKFNLQGKDIKHPENHVELLTPDQRAEIKRGWKEATDNRNRKKFIKENIDHYPIEVVKAIYREAKKYEHFLDTQNKTQETLDKENFIKAILKLN